jgi:hypothetical protein
VGIVVGAGISLAALVDPFSWMPSLADVWGDCRDERDTAADECDLATRFPGFWAHVGVNLLWAAAAVLGLLPSFAAGVMLREERAARFDDEEAAERYDGARLALAVCAGWTFVVAAVPIVVAGL